MTAWFLQFANTHENRIVLFYSDFSAWPTLDNNFPWYSDKPRIMQVTAV